MMRIFKDSMNLAKTGPSSMAPPANYVDLSRTFAPVPPKAGAEESALRSYAHHSSWLLRRSALTWENLLEHGLIVLLGEPGSGKSYELQYQASLSSPGRPRFYLRLDELAASGTQFQLGADDARRVAEWQESDAKAVFFLDSVDEAKIRQATDFYRALDRFLELVGRHNLARSTIVISSRITEWLPTTDGHEVKVRFPRQSSGIGTEREKSQSEEPHPFVVQLLPLNEEAVKTYAVARGITDAEQFLEELEKAHAWELARRPADVNDLLAFWRESDGLGTLTQVLAFVCESQLKKTSDRERSELLALERAQAGAECLAAATILCRRFIFRIPGEANADEHAIDALACLSEDWRTEEVRALLNHAVFDGASYGHIRFHHRRLSEFLASRWIERLMVGGCPVAELEDILFEARGSDRVLRPSLAPLAAWLCGGAARWNISVYRRILEVAPEILLRYGDPAALTIVDRRALLKALVQKADGRQHLWWEHDEATLSRLADPALASEVNDLITAPSSGRTLRELGLDLVIAGKLMECAPAVLTAAIADLASGEVFPTAARALKAVGRESDLRALAVASDAVQQFPNRVCVPLCDLLFPRIWSVSDLFVALRRMNPVAPGGLGWDYNLSAHLASSTKRENGLALLRGLLGNPVEVVESEDEFDPPSSVRAALAVSNVMLGWPALSEEEASAIAEVLVRVGGNRPNLSRDDFASERTERHPLVRERYFRRAAQQVANQHGYTDVRLFSVFIFHEMLRPIADDLSWILAWLEGAHFDRERQCALEWGLDLWRQTGRSRGDLARIKKTARRFPNTRNALWKYLHPGCVARAKAFWERRIRHRFYRHKLRMAWREMKKPFFKLRDMWRLWRYRSKMRSGEYAGLLGHLVLSAHPESYSQWMPKDFSLLQEKWGKKCAIAVKEGCKCVWRRYEPPLPHEKKPNEGTAYHIIAGMVGITVAWQEGELRFEDLSFDDALRATRYALSEMNGFAPWFADLIHAQPEAVRSVLSQCVSGEWEIAANSEQHHLVLSHLVWTDSPAGDLIKPTLMERLVDSEPKNPHILRDVLCIVVRAPSPRPTALAALAKSRSATVPISAPSFPLWMALWLQADAPAAIGTLESQLSSATDPTSTMISICANISSRSGNQPPLLPKPSWLTAAAMRRFVPLVYRYIRREDDIDRSGGGAYSPTARDDAQEFRGGLFERFVATGDPEVEPVLQEFLSEPLFLHLSDYLKHLLEKHREQLADGPPWRARDVRTFATEYERDPQDDTDLFRIGCRRLFDLKQWVETGEDSPRREVHVGDNESGFRDWLRRKLNESARGRYVVPPEWEIVGGRPDLRLVIPGAAPVSLELKIADNWPLQELLDGLEQQLVGTYMRDSKARYGIYVLAQFNRRREWVPLDGPRIDSAQMLGILQKRAQQILDLRLDISGLEVVLIHFFAQAG